VARRRLVVGLAYVLSAAGLAWILARVVTVEVVGPEPAPAPRHVGSAACATCHAGVHARWSGSHHQRAMEPASESSVLGDFAAAPHVAFGETTTFRRDGERFLIGSSGPSVGERVEERAVGYTFGLWPLQQLLVPHTRGRWQAHLVSWDARDAAAGGQRWFRLRPEDGALPASDLFHSFGPMQTWNAMCAECHSTGVRKGYDRAHDAYATTAAEHGVGCEACHGPGEAHVAWAQGRAPGAPRSRDDPMGLVLRLKEAVPRTWVLDAAKGIYRREPPGDPRPQVDLCGRCHSRRGTLHEADAGTPLHETHRVALLDEGLYFPDGQVQDEVFEHGSFLQSRMFHAGVTCSDCHTDHASLTRQEGAAESCARCHQPERYATRAHTFHAPGTPGSRCVDCHMPTRTYMVVHARRDHSIRIPRPDLSLTLGTPNACNGCHQDKDARWATQAVERWWGPKVAARAHYGTTLAAGRQGAPGAGTALVRLVGDASEPAIVRATAAALLARAPALGAAAALTAASADPDPLVRRGAVEGADALPPDARRALLLARLDDVARAVRVEAARALAGARDLPAAQAERLEQVLAEARAAAELAADQPDGLTNLANLLRACGEPAEAERAYREVLRRTPDYPLAAVNLADLLRELGRDAEGLAVLDAALLPSPASAALHHARGLALVRLGRRAEAGPALERAWVEAPADAGIALAVALWHDAEGRLARAREVLALTLLRVPYGPGLLSTAAGLAERAGDTQARRELLTRLLALRPWDEGLRAQVEGR
jgi:tetratricopeptide (TPR) repeat protein